MHCIPLRYRVQQLTCKSFCDAAPTPTCPGSAHISFALHPLPTYLLFFKCRFVTFGCHLCERHSVCVFVCVCVFPLAMWSMCLWFLNCLLVFEKFARAFLLFNKHFSNFFCSARVANFRKYATNLRLCGCISTEIFLFHFIIICCCCI